MLIELSIKKKTKLTFEEAEIIRQTYRINPKASYRNLAKQYGVSKTLIEKIIKNKIYKPEKYEGDE